MTDAFYAKLDDRLDALLGQLTERVEGKGPGFDRTAYLGRPVAFVIEVLRMRLLRWQRAWLDAFHQHAVGQFVVWSANGCGKTALLAALLIYMAVVVQGTALYFSATEKQTRTQMVSALKRLVHRTPALDADVYNYGVAFPGAGTVYFGTMADVSAMQGHHAADLLVVADEAQALSADQLAALQGCTVGERNVIVLAGNPLTFGTVLHKLAVSADPSWHRTKVTALDVITDPEHPYIPGLTSKRAVDALRQTWGEESATFQARVYANFPKTPTDAFFPEHAITAAFARHSDAAFIARQRARRLTIGLDVGASFDGDESVLVPAKGGWVRELVTWREPDTMKSVGRVVEELRRLAVMREYLHVGTQNRLIEVGFGELVFNRPGDPLAFGTVTATIRVDEIGVGKGLSDRLAELGYDVEPFNASKRPDEGTATNDRGDKASERYQNKRAEAYDRFRTMLVSGEVAVPYDPLLEEELRTCRAFTNSSGRLQILAKKEWRDVLGRSPDRLDGVIIATAADGTITFDTATADAEFAF